MTPPRLAILVPAFQVPTVGVALLGAGIELSRGGRFEGVIAALFGVPTAVAMLLAALTTWALERWRPRPAPSLGRTLLRYELPAFGFTQPICLFFAWFAGAFMNRQFQYDTAGAAYAVLVGGYAVFVALPLLVLALLMHRHQRRRSAA